MTSVKKIIRIFNEANVRFVLMGAHGIGGWRRKPRSTQDIDLLVAKKDHAKAVNVLKKAFPKLLVEDSFVVTRFKDPTTGEARVDLMKPSQKIFQMAFRYTQTVEDSYEIPDLEMALISKFAAMVSPHRAAVRKMQDATDFAEIVIHNQDDLDRRKLARMAEQVYKNGRVEILKLVKDILEGKPITI